MSFIIVVIIIRTPYLNIYNYYVSNFSVQTLCVLCFSTHYTKICLEKMQLKKTIFETNKNIISIKNEVKMKGKSCKMRA